MAEANQVSAEIPDVLITDVIVILVAVSILYFFRLWTTPIRGHFSLPLSLHAINLLVKSSQCHKNTHTSQVLRDRCCSKGERIQLRTHLKHWYTSMASQTYSQ